MKPIAFLLFLLPLFGTAQRLKPAEYLEWVNSADYPLQVRVTKNGVSYTLKALTPQAIAARQLLSGDLTVAEAKELLKKNKGISSYELKIELPAGSDIYSYNGNGTVDLADRATYWAFNCIKDFTIKSSAGESLDCSFALTERGLAGYPVSIVSLDFPLYLKNASSIIFLDRALTGEPIEFSLQQISSPKQPQLIL